MLTQNSLLWYTPHHYEMSVIGEIIENNGDFIRYTKTKEHLGENETQQDIFAIRMKNDRIIVEVHRGKNVELIKVNININKIISRQAYLILKE